MSSVDCWHSHQNRFFLSVCQPHGNKCAFWYTEKKINLTHVIDPPSRLFYIAFHIEFADVLFFSFFFEYVGKARNLLNYAWLNLPQWLFAVVVGSPYIEHFASTALFFRLGIRIGVFFVCSYRTYFYLNRNRFCHISRFDLFTNVKFVINFPFILFSLTFKFARKRIFSRCFFSRRCLLFALCFIHRTHQIEKISCNLRESPGISLSFCEWYGISLGVHKKHVYSIRQH